MRILFVTHAYAPSKGGVQWLVQSLAERLTEQFHDQVTVFTTVALRCELFIDPDQPRLPAGETQIGGVCVRRFNVFNRLTWLRLTAARIAYKLRLPGQDLLRGLYFGPIVPGLRKAIAAQPADVIVAASFPMIHMYDALASGQRNRRPVALIGTVHPTDRWSYDLPRMYRAITQAQVYIALSSYERDHLALRCPGANLTVVSGGVDVEAMNAQEAGRAFRQLQGWADEDFVICMAGRITAYKRPDVMLSAMPAIWRALPNARLVFAGASATHQQDADLQTRIGALPHPDRVTWIKDFAEADKPAIFSAADVIVHLSDRESFGIVIIEGWAAGKAVIAPSAGAAPSIIADGQDGLLIPYGEADALVEAVTRLGRSESLRRALGAAGQAKARRFYDWSVVVPCFREVLLGVVLPDAAY